MSLQTADRMRAHWKHLEIYTIWRIFFERCIYFAFELSVCLGVRSVGLTLLAMVDVMLSYSLASRPGLDHQARAYRGRI
jgi:hypothetical protein